MHLGETGTEQFTVTTRVAGELIGQQKVHDPFIRTTVKLRGFKHAWRSLFGFSVQVSVDATVGAQRAIMTLDPYQIGRDTEEILRERSESRNGKTLGQYAVSGKTNHAAQNP